MKKLNNFLKLAPVVGLFSLVMGFSTCEYKLENKNNSSEQFVDGDSIYDHIGEKEARSLGELEKIYHKIYDLQEIKQNMNFYHAGEEEEGYNLEQIKLEKDADSIFNTLSTLGKTEAKGIYNDVFNSDN